MRKNEAGLTILEIGDVVRIGKGKVEYSVTVPESEANPFVTVRSSNTNKPTTIERERLTLVRDIRDNPVAYPKTEEAPVVEELTDVTPKESAIESGEGFPEDVPVVETSAYAKAVLFALNKLQKHVYAGTVRDNVKAQRRSLNGRQKASRKANR